MARQNTRLESEGAEFLVLGHLLIEGINASKSYTNFPGYDIIAYDPAASTTCRIQVKSRWATNSGGGFLIDNFASDFVVVVMLNRGVRYRKSDSSDVKGRRAPEYFVLPIDVAQAAVSEKSSWGKAFLRNIPDVQQYEANWELVREFLRPKTTS